MVEVINGILFVISMLFGLDNYFQAEQTQLQLDFSTNKGSIVYLNATTPKTHERIAVEGMEKLTKAEQFYEAYTQFQLVSKQVEKQDNQLNITVEFTFDDQESLLELLRFNKTHYAQVTAKDKISYHILSGEEVVATNGSIIEGEENDVVTWQKDVSKIELELRQNGKHLDLVGESTSLAPYWQEK